MKMKNSVFFNKNKYVGFYFVIHIPIFSDLPNNWQQILLFFWEKTPTQPYSDLHVY